MSVVRTEMRPGSPTSAGTSNASMARMNTSIDNARMEGSDSRNVTRAMVAPTPAPLTRAASSSSGLAFAQGRGHQEKCERRPQEALHHDHAGHGIDVDQNVGCSGERAVELVDRAGLAEKQQ